MSYPLSSRNISSTRVFSVVKHGPRLWPTVAWILGGGSGTISDLYIDSSESGFGIGVGVGLDRGGRHGGRTVFSCERCLRDGGSLWMLVSMVVMALMRSEEVSMKHRVYQ